IVEHLCGLGDLPDGGFRFFAVPVKVRGGGAFRCGRSRSWTGKRGAARQIGTVTVSDSTIDINRIAVDLHARNRAAVPAPAIGGSDNVLVRVVPYMLHDCHTSWRRTRMNRSVAP